MFEMSRLLREQREIDKEVSKVVAALKKQGAKRDDIDCAIAELSAERQIVHDNIRKLVTRRSLAKANRHFLPVPAYGKEPFWEPSYATGGSYLTEEGIKAVRNERTAFWKARCQLAALVISTITGLIGALIGVFALILR